MPTYQFKDGSAKKSDTLLSSYLTPVQLLAKGETFKEILWQNLMVNSPYGIVPLRYKWEKETKGKL